MKIVNTMRSEILRALKDERRADLEPRRIILTPSEFEQLAKESGERPTHIDHIKIEVRE